MSVVSRWTPIVAAALLCTWNGVACAQSAGSGSPDDASSIGAWAGFARHSPDGPFGRSLGNDLAVVAVRLTRPLHRSASWSLDYSADLVPAAWVTMSSDFDTVLVRPCDPSKTACVFKTRFVGQRSIYGFGAAPFGLQLRLAPGARVQPFLTAAAGGLWFREPVPYALAGKFNFTAEVGAGLLYRPTRSLGVIAGYMLQHISNGGTRPYNPGIDNNMFYLGLMHLTHASSGADTRP
jgi:hypothetical protein